MFPIDRHTIFLAKAGSHAHGTARAGSDLDLRGVCVAPLALRLSLFHDFEQWEGEVPPGLAAHVTALLEAVPADVECVIFDIAKFLRLCANANPNTLEVLFTAEQDWLIATPAWRDIYAHRHRFLTRKVQQTFLGYAMGQLKRIKTHRSWLLHPPASKPLREDFGLPLSEGTLNRDDRHRVEQSIAERIRSYGIDDLDLPKASRIAVQERIDAFYRDVLHAADEDVADATRDVATTALGLPADVVATLKAERSYRAAMKQWDSYCTWKAHRNPARAALEVQHGYDTKHGAHLIRLMRMGLEVLRHGELYVRRADAAELLAIRDGALSYDELLAEATALQASMASEAQTTQLPRDIDRDFVDELLLRLVHVPRSPAITTPSC